MNCIYNYESIDLLNSFQPDMNRRCGIMLGEHIRSLRKEKNITLADLAEVTNLSAGYLSQVERGLVDPSLSSLRKIADALNVPAMLLIDDPFSKNLTVHFEQQPNVVPPGSTTVHYRLMSTLPSKDYMPGSLVLGFTLNGNSVDFEKPISHNAEEIVVVTEGEITINQLGVPIVLKTGDTTIIRKNIPHQIKNNNDTPAKGLSIFTPAIWSLQQY
jgi:DNA-binding XRE family transcriptional regulator